MVDAEGPAAMTMARLARDLEVGPMTLYGYVDSKDEIVAMLPDLLLEDLPPVAADLPWRDAVEAIYLGVHRRLVARRRVTQTVAESPAFGSAQAHVLEAVLERLVSAGFGDPEAFAIQRVLATYTFGFSLFAIAEHAAAAPRPRAVWSDGLDPAAFPHITRISALLEAGVDEGQFLQGLRRILQ